MHILGGTMFSHAVALTVASIIAFAAANIGDLIVLMLFFADQRFQPWQVVLGQYLGVSAVIGLCLLGAGPASHLPHMLIRALGIVPIAVGLHKLLSRPMDVSQINPVFGSGLTPIRGFRQPIAGTGARQI